MEDGENLANNERRLPRRPRNQPRINPVTRPPAPAMAALLRGSDTPRSMSEFGTSSRSRRSKTARDSGRGVIARNTLRADTGGNALDGDDQEKTCTEY